MSQFCKGKMKEIIMYRKKTKSNHSQLWAHGVSPLSTLTIPRRLVWFFRYSYRWLISSSGSCWTPQTFSRRPVGHLKAGWSWLKKLIKVAFVLNGSLIGSEHDKNPDQNMDREITDLDVHSVKGKIWGWLMNLRSLWTMTWRKTTFFKESGKKKNLGFFSKKNEWPVIRKRSLPEWNGA